MKTAFENPDNSGRFKVGQQEISETELQGLIKLFPAVQWLVIRFEGPPFTETKRILNKNDEHGKDETITDY